MWVKLGKTMIVVILGLAATPANAQQVIPCYLGKNYGYWGVNLSQQYSPGEFRQFLRGFGYDVVYGDILYDVASKKAIRDFQQGYQLPVDGTANPQSQKLAADLVTNIQGSLNLVLQLNPPLPRNQFYGLRTEIAIRRFQKRFNFPETGIATLPVRMKLDEETNKLVCIMYPPKIPPQIAPPPLPTNQPRIDGRG